MLMPSSGALGIGHGVDDGKVSLPHETALAATLPVDGSGGCNGYRLGFESTTKNNGTAEDEHRVTVC